MPAMIYSNLKQLFWSPDVSFLISMTIKSF
jgi:hypothetical protein